MTFRYLVRDIGINGSKLTISVDPDFASKYMREDFHLEYSRDIKLESLDWETLVAPFLLNIAPVVWIAGERVRLESMDADIFASLEKIRKTYKKMYPRHEWDGAIMPDRLTTAQERGITDPVSDETYVFFSGGVDSLYTSLRNKKTPQTLLAAWGGDIPLNLERKWQTMRRFCEDHAERYGYSTLYVKGNIQNFILRKSIYPDIQIWWSYVQFGMGLVGLAIPPLMASNASSIMIASDSVGDISKPWGSSLYLEGQIRFAGRHVIHHGLEANRQQKVAYIIDHYRKNDENPEPLRVCLRPYAKRVNCCDCEKCLRTIIALLLEGANPITFGFPISYDVAFHKVKAKIIGLRLKMSDTRVYVWQELQHRARELVDSPSAQPEMFDQKFFSWLTMVDFEQYHQSYKRKHALETWLKQQFGRFPRAFDLARGLVERIGWHS